MEYYVYKHTLFDGRTYIGITRQNPPQKDGKMVQDIKAIHTLLELLKNMVGKILTTKF